MASARGDGAGAEISHDAAISFEDSTNSTPPVAASLTVVKSDGVANARVYVHNLAWCCTAADLTAHFGAVGAVSHVKMLFFGDGRSKGCAIVTFEDASAAQRAIATLHNSTIDGRVVYVREDREEIGFNAQRSPVAHMSAPADGRAVPSASNAFAPLSNRASHGASVVNVPSPIMAVHWSQMQQMQKYQNAQNTQLMQHVPSQTAMMPGPTMSAPPPAFSSHVPMSPMSMLMPISMPMMVPMQLADQTVVMVPYGGGNYGPYHVGGICAAPAAAYNVPNALAQNQAQMAPLTHMPQMMPMSQHGRGYGQVQGQWQQPRYGQMHLDGGGAGARGASGGAGGGTRRGTNRNVIDHSQHADLLRQSLEQYEQQRKQHQQSQPPMQYPQRYQPNQIQQQQPLMAFVNSSGAIQYFVSSAPQSVLAAPSTEQQQHQQQQHQPQPQPPPQPQQHQQRILSPQHQLQSQQPQFQSPVPRQYPAQTQQVVYQSPVRANRAEAGFDSSLEHVQQKFGAMQMHDSGSTSAIGGTAIVASNASREQHLLAMQLQLQERDRLRLFNRRSSSASANGESRNHSGRFSAEASDASAGSHRSAASHAASHRPSS